MYSCNRCIELNIWSGCMICYIRFWVPVPDCYRYASNRIVPISISRITNFVFPTELSRTRFRFRIKIWKRNWLEYFPDRFWPLSYLWVDVNGSDPPFFQALGGSAGLLWAVYFCEDIPLLNRSCKHIGLAYLLMNTITMCCLAKRKGK